MCHIYVAISKMFPLKGMKFNKFCLVITLKDLGPSCFSECGLPKLASERKYNQEISKQIPLSIIRWGTGFHGLTSREFGIGGKVIFVPHQKGTQGFLVSLKFFFIVLHLSLGLKFNGTWLRWFLL